MSTPKLEEFFIKGSMWKLFRGANPYTFVETYRLLCSVFGYQLFYVNYGYWKDGIKTVEPGRELTYFIGDALGLKAGDKVLEAGSGLGQASIDSCSKYDLSKVLGLNLCDSQVNFANALTTAQNLREKIEHRICDACTEVDTFKKGDFDHAFAQECIGHFPDPLHYLKGVCKTLPSGGRMAITIVSSPKPPSKSLAYVENLFFGTVPKDGPHWENLFKEAGFNIVESKDITEMVFVPMFAAIRDRLKNDPKSMNFPWMTNLGLKVLLNRTENGIKTKTMGYHFIVGEVP
jgi:cyclopropane fatty-acyl-phospholipid synthase-like methyltransferase